MNTDALGLRVSKSRRQEPDSHRQHPDRYRQPPTAHLHRQGRVAEDRRARDRIWRDQAREGVIEWIPYLNTRVDLTLKLGTEELLKEERHQDLDRDKASLAARCGIGDFSGGRYQMDSVPSGLQKRWYRFSESEFTRAVGYFMHDVNRQVLRPRRSDRQPPRLNAYVVLEYSPVGHLHPHALVERPPSISLPDFAAIIRRAWLGTKVGVPNMLIDHVRDLRACVTYNTKARDAFDRVPYVWSEPDDRAWWRHLPANERVPNGCGPICYRR